MDLMRGLPLGLDCPLTRPAAAPVPLVLQMAPRALLSFCSTGFSRQGVGGQASPHGCRIVVQSQLHWGYLYMNTNIPISNWNRTLQHSQVKGLIYWHNRISWELEPINNFKHCFHFQWPGISKVWLHLFWKHFGCRPKYFQNKYCPLQKSRRIKQSSE